MLYVSYNKKRKINNEDDENEFDVKKYIRPAYISKYNSKRDTQVNIIGC